MNFPIQITFRDVPRSEALEARIQERASALERYFQGILSCRVTMDYLNRHNHKGRLYSVKVDLSVPGRELVVSRDAHNDHSHEDPYVAVRDAFDAAKRELEEWSRRLHDKTKHHTPRANSVLFK